MCCVVQVGCLSLARNPLTRVPPPGLLKAQAFHWNCASAHPSRIVPQSHSNSLEPLLISPTHVFLLRRTPKSYLVDLIGELPHSPQVPNAPP